MRILLFLVSLGFSFIFYNFYQLSNGKNLFGTEVLKVGDITALSPNLLIETLLFLFIGIVFLFSFSPLDKSGKYVNKTTAYSMIFYLILLIPLSFSLFSPNKIILSLVVIFIFGDLSFRVLSNTPVFSSEKVKLRYLGIALNYLALLPSLLYTFLVGFSYYLFLICLFSIIFNYQVHKKYANYVSLFLAILTAILLILYLVLKFEQFYVLYF